MEFEANYQLLDSGAELRLERFGEHILTRPSTLCVWKPRCPDQIWFESKAEYNHKVGWKFSGAHLKEWSIVACGVRLLLRLQENGQIGFFPEHQSYISELERTITTRSQELNRPCKVLNLFAYTGLASLVAIKLGAHVTHVDISKKVLDWASDNFALNELPKTSLRFIKEDALEFLAKEIRRQKLYDLVLADPPSFSRVSDRRTWSLEEELPQVLADLVSVLEPQGSLFFSSHLTDNGGQIATNLLSDLLTPNDSKIELRQMGLQEAHSRRILPAGQVIIAQKA